MSMTDAVGEKVLSRDGKKEGVFTGTTRRCQMEGCTGRAFGVRWEDGKLTWPCGKGMEYKNGGWQIM